MTILEDAYFFKSSYYAKFYDPTLSGTESKCVGCIGMILGFHESLSDSQNLLAVRRVWYMNVIPVLTSLWSENCSQQIFTFLQFLSFYVTDKVHEPPYLNMTWKGRGHMLRQQIILWITLVFHWTATQNVWILFFELIIINFCQPVVIFKCVYGAATFDKDIGMDKWSMYLCQ